jgi:hypothetical protein
MKLTTEIFPEEEKMIAQSTRAQCNLKLNLKPNSVLYNVLTGDDCKDIKELICIQDLETSLNDLLAIDQSIHEQPSCRELEGVRVFTGEILKDILDCLPQFVGGLRFHNVEVFRDKNQIIWDLSTLDPLFEN